MSAKMPGTRVPGLTLDAPRPLDDALGCAVTLKVETSRCQLHPTLTRCGGDNAAVGISCLGWSGRLVCDKRGFSRAIPEDVGSDPYRRELGEWSGRLDSNQRPPAPKAGALPGCATPRL